MMESVLRIDCEGAPLVAILAEPTDKRARLGVLIVVGGPQYRVGSHRQFTLLARHLASQGIAVLRFDYRGMGDAPGAARDFLEVGADIEAAIDGWQAARPELERVVLWGLCDAASAALLYLHRGPHPKVAGLCLLNPWVRSTASLAKATLKHYYRRRLLQREFWLKLISGRMGQTALRSLFGNITQARRANRKAPEQDEELPFQDRMLLALQATHLPCLLVLSSHDQTAQEFIEYARTAGIWERLQSNPGMATSLIDGADHTFSKLAHQHQMFECVSHWLAALTAPSVACATPSN